MCYGCSSGKQALFFCIIHNSSISTLSIAGSSSTWVFWCGRQCTVLFLSLFHPLVLMVSVHMENSQSAEKEPTSCWPVRHYHLSTCTSTLRCSLKFWWFFFVYLIFSLFCSMFCTCYAISQKATALQQPLTDFFFSHILCSLVQDRFYTAIRQDRCGCRGTCRYPQLWCLSVCPQWSSGYEPKIRGSPPSISQRLQRPKPGECLSQVTVIRRGMKAGQETWGWKSSGKCLRCRQNLQLGVATFY